MERITSEGVPPSQGGLFLISRPKELVHNPELPLSLQIGVFFACEEFRGEPVCLSMR